MSVGQRWDKDEQASIQLKLPDLGSFYFEDLFDDEDEQMQATIPKIKIQLFFM